MISLLFDAGKQKIHQLQVKLRTRKTARLIPEHIIDQMQRFFTDRCFFEFVRNDSFAATGVHAGRDTADQPGTEHMIIGGDDQYPCTAMIGQKCFGVQKIFHGDLGTILTMDGGFRHVQLKKLTAHHSCLGDRGSRSLSAAGDD